MNAITGAVLTALVLVQVIGPIKAEAAPTGGETTDGATILTQSANITCLGYELIGVCVWLSCSWRGCRLATSIKVKHYIPDAVVTAYQNTGESPWVETAVYGPPSAFAQDGGSNKEGSTVNNETAFLFKNVDVIGSPGNLWIQALRRTGFFCNPTTTPYFPYMVSTLDPNWRDPTIETPWTLINALRVVRSGLSTWGGVYPRMGFVHQGHDYKAGALAAQRAADITTRRHQPHIYWPMLASGSRGQWPPGAVIEGDVDTHKWQQLIPVAEASECRVFADQSDHTAGPTGPFRDRLSQITGYAFNLWRPYRCCRRAGSWLIFHTGN